jgi:hypothetical protein
MKRTKERATSVIGRGKDSGCKRKGKQTQITDHFSNDGSSIGGNSDGSGRGGKGKGKEKME